MTLEKLKENIINWKIPESFYSINEGLKPNAYIIFENYNKWEFFFLDEKGERIGYEYFKSNEDIYEHPWNKLYKEIQYPPSIPPPSVYG